MSGHARFSPSSAHRWLECPGSMAFVENHGDEGSSPYADEGSAAHEMASRTLKAGTSCHELIGVLLFTGSDGTKYYGTEEMADHVQVYVDEVDRRRIDRPSWIEQQVDIAHVLRTPGQFGTPDCIIAHPADGVLEVIDLKYGRGEKVSAQRNFQLMLYALGALRLPELDLIYEFDTIRLCIAQVRLAPEFAEWECSLGHLLEFQDWAWKRCQEAAHCFLSKRVDIARENHLIRPGEKQCRWCAVKATCPELAKYVQDAVARDFEVIAADEPTVPQKAETIAKAMVAVPLVEVWCNAVREQAAVLVDHGEKILGPDGLPMKFVEGRAGKRKWTDELAAEAALVGQLPPEKAYQPQKIITAPAASKIFNKKRTQALWDTVFKPLVTQGAGKRKLVFGSDPRPAFIGAASADEFDDESESE